MRCLIIDGSPQTNCAFERWLRSASEITSLSTAIHPYEIRSIISEEKIEVVFIRVHLWDFRVFLQLDCMPAIVFLCGVKDKLADTPGTMVPYRMGESSSLQEITQLLDKLKGERIIESPGYFFVRFEGRFHRFFFNDIEMVERLQSGYLKIWTRFRSIMLAETIPHLLTQLPEKQFIRVSDTLVLPMSRANSINGDEYTFRGRKIKLTYRFKAVGRKEMKRNSDWTGWSLL